ncbi:MAG: hypothetical protein IJZ23_06995 [Roseburia sp.]|nr:hypothetical protein [Roseburia sp.]MBQ8279572.1 hypothetical protein [Roseburia sp.]
MADIKNKNELKRRTELFLDEFSHEEYMINEPFCKETMRMMREFIGHASHLLDCADAKIKKAKRTARAKAVDDFAEKLCEVCCENAYNTTINGIENVDILTVDSLMEIVMETAEQLKGGA